MFVLPKLSYGYNALEPYMSEQTLLFHHTKHHQSYIDNLNKLIENTEFEDLSLEKIIIQTADDIKYEAVFNNAAQTYNHNFFFAHLSPSGAQTPPAELFKRIEKTFGSYEIFKSEFKNAALSQFGSGWAWLAEDGKENLKILKTLNADTPVAHHLKPLLCIDVWEHAYYLDFQNRRADFIDTFLEHLIKW